MKHGHFITTILLIFFIVQIVSSSRSPERLASLAKTERDIYNVIHGISSTSQENPLVKEYLGDFNESSLKILQESNLNYHNLGLRIANNPIMSYRMVRRYARFLRPFYKEMPPIVKQEIFKKIGKGRTEVEVLSEWPSQPDLDEAMEAILRIHHVYNVNLEEFTSGNIMGVETQIGLTGKQCYEIGEFALQSKQFTSAILWLETALNKSERSEDSAVLTEDILKTLQLARESHDVAWKDKTNRDYFYFHQKLNETVQGKRVRIRDVEFEQRKRDQYKPYDCDLRVWGICSGQNYQTNEEMAKLFCWYERRSNAAWTINPLKIEQLSISPYLIQIHDALRNQTIDKIKKEANPRLARSTRWEVNYIPVFRDSFQGFLAPSDLTKSLSRHIELITGLSVTSSVASENFFIKAYAPGGQDGCHLDYVARQDNQLGNRLASIIFYLEDVGMGGYTAFPAIGVGAKPIKGSAIFWYNMLRNGEPDVRTEHAGCPVVLGQKWITLKSIRVNAQMLTRPCGLSKDE